MTTQPPHYTAEGILRHYTSQHRNNTTSAITFFGMRQRRLLSEQPSYFSSLLYIFNVSLEFSTFLLNGIKFFNIFNLLFFFCHGLGESPVRFQRNISISSTLPRSSYTLLFSRLVLPNFLKQPAAIWCYSDDQSIFLCFFQYALGY